MIKYKEHLANVGSIVNIQIVLALMINSVISSNLFLYSLSSVHPLIVF